MLEKQVSQPKEILKEVFGYDNFRGNQEKIIENLLDGNNTFVIMPTGAGKSLCYQLPALVKQGTALIISPLIALMKNQVDQLKALGIEAQVLNSTLSKSEANKVKADVKSAKTKLLYVAPESLTKEENINFFSSVTISFVAIDEAHCISEWGHDFRPEYRRIKHIIGEIAQVPLIALTATATPKVQQDIIKNLDMEDADVFKSSFNRKNLYYEVRPKSGAKKELIKYIKKHKGKSGIVYCLSRKKAQEIAELLCVNGINALPYHAGLDPGTRIKNQDAFLNEDVDVICATIAFGMGIDKPDIRFVVHYDVPKSIEGYYQETGRAGRDGLEGNCLLFYAYKDILKLEKFNKDKPISEKENTRHLLMEMAAYAETAMDRRKFLLHYFGEEYDERLSSLKMCDNTRFPKDKFEVCEEVQVIIQAVMDVKERFGLSHIIDVIRGSENQYVLSYGHDKLQVYGKGAEHSKEYWNSMIRQILIGGFLYKSIENYGTIGVTEKGKAYMHEPYPIMVYKERDFSDATGDEDSQPAAPSAGYDKALFSMLKDLRKKVAKQKDVPPYVVFQDPSLEEMATVLPTDEEELAQIHGVGKGKVQKFGKPFLDLINKYAEENDVVTSGEILVKSSVNKSRSKIQIIQQIDRLIDPEEIAESLKMNMSQLLDELEQICFSGTKLNLDYYIEEILDEDRLDDLFDYFMTAESDDLADAMAELEDDYSEEEVRFVRIKFMSELAN